MIDFTHCEVNRYRAYGGANGNKIHMHFVITATEYRHSRGGADCIGAGTVHPELSGGSDGRNRSCGS